MAVTQLPTGACPVYSIGTEVLVGTETGIILSVKNRHLGSRGAQYLVETEEGTPHTIAHQDIVLYDASKALDEHVEHLIRGGQHWNGEQFLQTPHPHPAYGRSLTSGLATSGIPLADPRPSYGSGHLDLTDSF